MLHRPKEENKLSTRKIGKPTEVETGKCRIDKYFDSQNKHETEELLDGISRGILTNFNSISGYYIFK